MRDGPETIIWLVTSKCNLNCRHCYALPYRFEKDLSTKLIFKVVDDAAEVGVEHIHYTGGEPLMRNDIFDILEYTLNLGLEASLFTNSTLVNSDVASRLARLEIPIYTSIDGHSKEVYESLRGRGTWEKFLRGVKLLVSHGLYVHMNISVTEVNWMYVDEIIKKAVSLGASSISIIPAMPVGNALKYGTYVRPKHYVEALKKAANIAEELGIYVSVWCTPFTPLVVKSERLTYSNCRDWEVMDISPSGRVLLCDVLNVDVGNVLKLGVRGAWRALKNHPLIRNAERVISKEPCSSCPIKSVCRGGCYARAYIAYGTTEAPDPLCPRVVKRYEKVKARY